MNVLFKVLMQTWICTIIYGSINHEIDLDFVSDNFASQCKTSRMPKWRRLRTGCTLHQGMGVRLKISFWQFYIFFYFFKGFVRDLVFIREIAVTIRHCAKVMKNVFRSVGVEWTADSNIKTQVINKSYICFDFSAFAYTIRIKKRDVLVHLIAIWIKSSVQKSMAKINVWR